MTPEEQLALLEELRAKERDVPRTARRAAFASIVLAASVIAALLYFAYRQLGEVKQQERVARNELGSLQTELGVKKAELDRVNTQLAKAKTSIGALNSVVDEVPQQTLEQAIERAKKKDPRVELPARIYLQTATGESAMRRAKEVQRQLREAGFTVPGISQAGQGHPQTIVRYYRPEEGPQAEKIAEELRRIGLRVAAPQNLNLKNTSAARPNHYDVALGTESAH